MFDLYSDYFKGKIPYIKLEKRAFGGYSAERIIIKNTNQYSQFDGYSDPLESYKERQAIKTGAKHNDSDSRYMRVLLVSNDINRIRKSAVILADGYAEESYDDYDEYDYDSDDFEDFDSCESGIFEIELAKDMTDERVAGNPYIIKIKTITEGARDLSYKGLLFRGLETGNLSDQCDGINSIVSQNVFVGISEELLEAPEIQRLIFERGFDLIRLPDVDPAYYHKIADELIEFGKVEFETKELKETIIGNVIKKCGNYISEERISAALTMGRVRMEKGEPKFSTKHFEDIFDVSAENASAKLKKMTGLDNLKTAVREYVAIRNEMKRNPKAFLECRHLIFEGNPGGGKTIGAKILSDILAAEGITNGSFVVASRKDIIAEYVGQTAPKVAKLFKDAAGGVLFVDEAGFFLNTEAGGYIDEAIKEFVRYMETCRDVTVIFAMYPGEAKRVLELDAGLPSRISATIRFEDYSKNQLSDIFCGMVTEKGYRVSKQISAKAGSYLMELKDRFGERFGNAREARRLSDAVIKAIAIRHDDPKQNVTDKHYNDVTAADLNSAIKSMETHKHSSNNKHIGFVTSDTSRIRVRTA